MRLEIIPEHALTLRQDHAIGELLDRAFGPDAGFHGRSFHKMRHHVRVIAWQGDQMIGHVALQLRAIRVGPTPLTIAAVAEVATDPEHRGKGVGTETMRRALEAAGDSMSSFAVLFGHPGLYAPLGFQAQPNRLTYVTWDLGRPSGRATEKIGSLMVCPLGSDAWDASADIDLCGPLF